MNDDYTVNDFERIAIDLENHREAILFGLDGTGVPPPAEQHFLMALSHLEIASKLMRLDRDCVLELSRGYSGSTRLF